MHTEQISLPDQTIIAARHRVPVDKLREYFDHFYPLLGEVLGRAQVTPLAARAYYFAPPSRVFDVAAGFAVSPEDAETLRPLIDDIPDKEGVEIMHFAASDALTAQIEGSYDQLGPAWATFTEQVLATARGTGEWAFEEYVTMPGGSEEPVTDLYFALATTEPQAQTEAQ